jgi:hypothetical protein
MVKIRKFLDAGVRAFVAANATEPAPALTSVDDLEAHAAAIVARGERDALRRVAAARLGAVWQAGHEAIALVVADRKAAGLPPAYIRDFSPWPVALDAAEAWLNPKPHYSSARSQINRLERLRAEREDRADFENVRVLAGQGVAPGARERVPRRSA